jgi:hypothetical protein
MLDELSDTPGEMTPEELEELYAEALAAVIREHGVETIAERADVPEDSVHAAAAGELDGVTLEQGAAILALAEDHPPAEDIVMVALDDLLMGMTSAVLDVEALESAIGGELDSREIQQKVEGRQPMTLAEYALLHQQIQSRIP